MWPVPGSSTVGLWCGFRRHMVEVLWLRVRIAGATRRRDGCPPSIKQYVWRIPVYLNALIPQCLYDGRVGGRTTNRYRSWHRRHDYAAARRHHARFRVWVDIVWVICASRLLHTLAPGRSLRYFWCRVDKSRARAIATVPTVSR